LAKLRNFRYKKDQNYPICYLFS